MEEFRTGIEQANMNILPREFQMMMEELDPQQQGAVNYKAFLNQVYVTRLYLQELELQQVLQEADTEGRGGITIAEMKQLLFED